jgi:hypothetical protein
MPLPYPPFGPYCCNGQYNQGFHFDPTGNNPNIPRGLVGSGYYGAYSPDSYQHPPCFVDRSAASSYNAAYAPAGYGPTGGYYTTGQFGQSQTTYNTLNAAPASSALQPAASARPPYSWR